MKRVTGLLILATAFLLLSLGAAQIALGDTHHAMGTLVAGAIGVGLWWAWKGATGRHETKEWVSDEEADKLPWKDEE